MTDSELTILRKASLGPTRGAEAGRHVTVEAASAAEATPATGWQRVGYAQCNGWIDNLDEGGGTFMVYGSGETVWALRFGEVLGVDWQPAQLTR